MRYNEFAKVLAESVAQKPKLQAGTPLHWPVPAKTQETLAESQPFYTFGGPTRLDGVNTSNKGWR